MLARLAHWGQRYDGPACYCDDPQLVPRPGFYALTTDGKHVRRRVPLIAVPGGYEHAGLRRHRQGTRFVQFSANPTGTTEVAT